MPGGGGAEPGSCFAGVPPALSTADLIWSGAGPGFMQAPMKGGTMSSVSSALPTPGAAGAAALAAANINANNILPLLLGFLSMKDPRRARWFLVQSRPRVASGPRAP
jgi:hypothetical protein